MDTVRLELVYLTGDGREQPWLEEVRNAGAAEGLTPAAGTALREDLARAHNNIGAHHAERGELAEAERHLDVAARLAPRLHAVRCNRAAVILLAGRPQAAAEDLRTSMDGEPNEPACWNNIGAALLAKGETAAATVMFREAGKMDSSSRIYPENLRAARNRTGLPEQRQNQQTGATAVGPAAGNGPVEPARETGLQWLAREMAAAEGPGQTPGFATPTGGENP